MERVIKKFRDRRNLRGRDWGAFCLKYQSELQFLSQSAVTALAPEHIRPHSEQFQAIVLLSLSFGELICPGLAYRSDKRSVGAWNVVCSAWPTSQVLSGKTFIVFYGIHRGYPVTWIQVWQTVTRETLQAAWRWVGLTDAAWKLVQRRDGGVLAALKIFQAQRKKTVLSKRDWKTFWRGIECSSCQCQKSPETGWGWFLMLLDGEIFVCWWKTDYLYGGLWRECFPVDSRFEQRFWCHFRLPVERRQPIQLVLGTHNKIRGHTCAFPLPSDLE